MGFKLHHPQYNEPMNTPQCGQEYGAVKKEVQALITDADGSYGSPSGLTTQQTL